MIKRISYLCCAVALLLTMGIPVRAAGGGKIRVHLNVGELPVINGSFTIYQVGKRISDGYRIGEEYGGGFVREEDALSPHLAQWMTQTEGKMGTELLMDVDGDAVFTELEEGLYLVEQTQLTDGFYPIQPFLITMPCENRWEVIVNTDPLPRVMDSPPTGQDPAPVIGLIGMVVSLAGLYLCSSGKPGRNRNRYRKNG